MFIFFDSDDAILPECLEKAFVAAEKDEADIVAFGAVEKEGGRPDLFIRNGIWSCGKVWDGKELFVELKRNSEFCAPVQFKLWKKDFLVQGGLRFYEGIYHEDELFSFSALMVASKVVCLPDILYEYYRTPGSIMRQEFTFRHIESLIVVIDEIEKINESGTFSGSIRNAIVEHFSGFYAEVCRRMSLVGFSNLPETSSLFDGRKQNLYAFTRALARRLFPYELSYGQRAELNSYGHILVYGAGLVAKQLIPCLLKDNIQGLEIVVSDATKNAASLFGIPVRSISDISYPKEACLVLIAVGKRFIQEVKTNVMALGYTNLIVLA